MQTRDLLIGEAVIREIGNGIRDMSVGEDKFLRVSNPHTMHFGLDYVLVTMNIAFDEHRSAGDLMKAVDEVQRQVRERFPAVKKIFIDPEQHDDHELS